MRDKRKEEQSHILQCQKEIRDRVQHYRSMELDIQEKVIKDGERREAKSTTKEALVSTNASTEPSSDTVKGKSPMEEVPRHLWNNRSRPICTPHSRSNRDKVK